jgi:putative ABC transport system substrate-binding protein
MKAQIGRRNFVALCGGAAMSWSFAADAQVSGRVPKIGVLFHAGSPEEEGPYFTGIIEGFKALGYIEGRNVKFEHRFPNEIPDRFTRMAAELAASVDVLIAVGDRAAVYAKNASSTVPIVFVIVPDPIASKLVNSFAQPGGNVTGLSTYAADLIGRRLQILKEILPGLSRVAQLVNPSAPIARSNVEWTKAAAAELGLTVRSFEARSLDELEAEFDAMAKSGMEAVTVSAAEGLPMQGRDVIPKLALAHRLALCAFSRETFEPGALMSYGTDQVANVRGAAIYVDKILKGAKPADLPVQGPTRFEFLLNLKTAKALGIEVPPIMIGRADEVIE